MLRPGESVGTPRGHSSPGSVEPGVGLLRTTGLATDLLSLSPLRSVWLLHLQAGSKGREEVMLGAVSTRRHAGCFGGYAHTRVYKTPASLCPGSCFHRMLLWLWAPYDFDQLKQAGRRALAGPLRRSGAGAAAAAPWAVFGGMTCAVTGRREAEQGTVRSRSLAASWGWRGHPQHQQSRGGG